MSDVLVSVKSLDVHYYTRMGVVKSLDKVSLDIDRGQLLGLVGESGCGKSTLGFSLLRLIPAPGRIVGGSIVFDGEELLDKDEEYMRHVRGKRISMVFQDPMTSLNPLQKIGDHLVETITTHEAVSKEEAWKRAEELVDRLGISASRLSDYPHQFSGGMRQRIMICLALALGSDFIIADEPTTSLDVIVEAQILDLLKELKASYDLTLMLITHNMGIVAELVDRVAVMYAAKIVEVADAASLFAQPLHPYTQGLLKSIPNIKLLDQEFEIMKGSPPDLIDPPSGCRFHPRCPQAMDICSEVDPAMKRVQDGTIVACHLY
ncbi:MAG: ABC transporter ATP-binding protein [Anaerolineae bacterium]|nr:ABC transporter ATP-binding protein [Anaerolineae bacterium]